MPNITEYNEWYSEADDKHQDWAVKAKNDWSFYNGDQWDDEAKNVLKTSKRPCLTLNYIRRLVRLLVGYEMRTRYNIKVYPVGDKGDDEVARMLTRILKSMERQNQSDFIYSASHKYGLITGRGWIGTRINRDENIYGELELFDEDPYSILVDPFGRKLDLKDHKYQIRDTYLEHDKLIYYYPDKEKEIDQIPREHELARNAIGSRDEYHLREFWYREHEKKRYLIDLRNGTVYDRIDDEDVAQSLVEQETHALVERNIPKVKYAVLCGDEILEEQDSPYTHPYYPYVPFFCEFLPYFDDIDADWLGIVRDLIDPQKEINKRRSEFVDILIREVNTGWIIEEDNLIDPKQLDRMGTEPGVKVFVKNIGKIREKVSGAPNPALYQVGASTVNELLEIAGINPGMLGYESSSREPAKAVMVRQQQGNVMVAPYQDNFRLTRLMTSKIALSLIPKLYSATRMARIIAPDGTLQSMSPEDLQAMQRILKDVDIGKYDVELAEAPQTPTQRIAEFTELKEILEIMAAFGMAPTPGMLKALVESSDVAKKGEVSKEIDVMVQQAQQAAQQEQANAPA